MARYAKVSPGEGDRTGSHPIEYVGRAPTDEFVTALTKERMSALTHLFQPTAEIIADFSPPRPKSLQTNAAAILAMFKKRP